MGKKAYNRIDFTGKRVGDWTINKYSRTTPKGNVYWEALCNKCGVTKEVSTASLRLGSKHCFACRELGYKDPKEATYKTLFRKIKNKNRKMGCENSIGYKEFKELLAKACSYCGTEPENEYGYQKKIPVTESRRKGSMLTYSGIDRVDNSKGYEKGNVVPCCKRCNIGKTDRSYEKFKAWIKKVHDHMKL